MAASANHPLLELSEEDLNMVCSFILLSGSIKDLAAEYGVSYPTMRSRLNGLIDRLKARVEGDRPDPLSDYLAEQITAGRMSADTARMIRTLHHDALAALEPASEEN